VHIEDISRAFLAVIEADRSLVHNEAFNVGATEENYQIRDVAHLVQQVVPDSAVTLSDAAFNDIRNYRVNCDKLATALPEARPHWTVQKGIEELYEAYVRYGLTLDQLEGDRFMRIRHVQSLVEAGRIDTSLRWTEKDGTR